MLIAPGSTQLTTSRHYPRTCQKVIPWGVGKDGDSTSGVQRTGTQESLSWLKNGITLSIWPCSRATGLPRLRVLCCLLLVSSGLAGA